MKPKLLLRIAAILMLIHTIGHSFGLAGWKKATDPVQKEVIRQMTGHKFPFMGDVHSIADYYEGFGYACTIAMLLITVTLWLAGNETERSAVFAKKLAFVFGIGLLIWGTDELIYFFPFAAWTSLISGGLTVWSGFVIGLERK